ncbi:SDR family NAD(P)-dependent oxidoreductase [Kineosporiaceae bacterium B12]|nr:SDR family NAD(P)-dependent oxidoreductase [Kineococcus rubinsiae]
MSGRTAIVTGASSGIGAATATALAARGARVVLAVRNPDKGARAARAMTGDVEVRTLDLADLASVRAFAAGWTDPLDLLINNAGVSVPDLQRTADGFELQLGTNHLGPFALTNLLLPRITGRVVTLSSQAERMGRLDLDDLAHERTPYRESRVYATSKLANLLFTAELQRRLTAVGSPVLAAAAHPGFVATGMTGASSGAVNRLAVRFLAQAPEQGALPVLLAATGDVPPGAFTGPEHAMHMRGGAQLIGRSKQARDAGLARRLWDVSEELTGVRSTI